jgi:hypothetical protein
MFHELFHRTAEALARAARWNREDVMRKGLILSLVGLGFLAGCGNWGNKPLEVSAASKWKIPYRVEFDTKTATPNPSGITIPAVIYTANPKALERRASMVLRFDGSATKGDQPAKDQVIMSPFDVPGSAGTLSATTMDLADRKLAKLLWDRCMVGKVKISLVLVRSSIKPDAGEAEINAKRLSDWLSTEVLFTNAHPKKC